MTTHVDRRRRRPRIMRAQHAREDILPKLRARLVHAEVLELRAGGARRGRGRGDGLRARGRRGRDGRDGGARAGVGIRARETLGVP